MLIRNYISIEREVADSNYLIDKIRQDDWIDKDTVIVNCSPEYSSRLVQLVNHRLSFINNNELYEVLNLELPKRDMSQVWDSNEREYRLFDKYLYEWAAKNVVKDYRYLFVTNTIYTGKNINKLKLVMNTKGVDFKIACVYMSDKSAILPDYRQKMFVDEPVFFWENTNKRFK